MSRVFVLVVALIAVTALIVWAASGSSSQVFGNDAASANLVYSILLLVTLLASLVLGWRGSANEALRSALLWIAFFLVLVAGYAYRGEIGSVWSRVAGEVNPAMPVQRSSSEVVLRKASDGHFYADADINGTGFRMLVDTGATMVVLSEADAASAGIDTDQLAFTLPVSTANGQTIAAEVTLDEVRVGSIVRHDVRAAVSKGLSGSLLGMSFFGTMHVSFDADELVLKD